MTNQETSLRRSLHAAIDQVVPAELNPRPLSLHFPASNRHVRFSGHWRLPVVIAATVAACLVVVTITSSQSRSTEAVSPTSSTILTSSSRTTATSSYISYKDTGVPDALIQRADLVITTWATGGSAAVLNLPANTNNDSLDELIDFPRTYRQIDSDNVEFTLIGVQGDKNAACGSDYVAKQVDSADVVTVYIEVVNGPRPHGCTQVGYNRTAVMKVPGGLKGRPIVELINHSEVPISN